jgi:tetratricopeptide (TPR) repeat protein
MEKKPSKYKIQKQEIPEFDLSPEVERLQNQLDRDPNSKVFLPLAEEYRRSKMPEEAIFVLEEGIKRNPTYSAAKIALARAYLEINEIMKAKQTIDEILSKMPHHPLAVKLHGDISFREGDFLEARKAYELVKQLNPMDLEVDQKLSELQVNVSGSKIEVASISEHEGEMQIERSYTEQKVPSHTEVPLSVDNRVLGKQQNGSTSQDSSIPPTPIPQQYQGTAQSVPIDYVQPPSVAGSDMYATDNQFSTPPIPKAVDNVPFTHMDTTPGSYSPGLDYNQQAYAQQQLQSNQFQESNHPVDLPETVNYNQTYIPPDSQVMEGVPLVSHEVVIPDRYAGQQEQYAYSENQEAVESSPDFQQAQNYQPPIQPDVPTDDIFNAPVDSGGFYTGPPTDPYVDQYGIKSTQGQAEMSNPSEQEFQTESQISAGYQLPVQSPANNDVAEAFPDLSSDNLAQGQILQPQNTMESVQDYNINPHTEGQATAKETAQSVEAHVNTDEFGLNELEKKINIPVPRKIEINDDLQQQQVMQGQQSPSASGDERITIDSLEIDGLNVEEMAKKYGTQEESLIETTDNESKMPSQYSEFNDNVLVDNIFKQSQTNQIPSVAGIKDKKSQDKYNMDLAELYTKQGHFDKALDIYKELLELQPDNQDIINRLIDTEKKKNAVQNVESTNVSPTERIAKMEEWFRTLLNNKKENGS